MSKDTEEVDLPSMSVAMHEGPRGSKQEEEARSSALQMLQSYDDTDEDIDEGGRDVFYSPEEHKDDEEGAAQAAEAERAVLSSPSQPSIEQKVDVGDADSAAISVDFTSGSHQEEMPNEGSQAGVPVDTSQPETEPKTLAEAVLTVGSKAPSPSQSQIPRERIGNNGIEGIEAIEGIERIKGTEGTSGCVEVASLPELPNPIQVEQPEAEVTQEPSVSVKHAEGDLQREASTVRKSNGSAADSARVLHPCRSHTNFNITVSMSEYGVDIPASCQMYSLCL